MFRQVGVPEDALVWVCGSTHSGEEAVLARVYQRLKNQFPNLFLVLVPRHFERGKEVGRELSKVGLKFVYRSEVSVSRTFEPGSVECLLVNSTGELMSFYEHATVIFVGKSLTAQGGQNPIEPGALAKPMVFGPNMQNFAQIAAAFVQQDGAVQVKDAAELEAALAALLADKKRREVLGQNAVKVVREGQGGIGRTVEMIVSKLPQDEVYVAP
jgi:3-deoxy-D-manno-octulosonic-acid transferase